MSYVSEVLADNPIGYWRLGEVAGPTCASQVNSPTLDGTAQNNPTFGVAGALTLSGDTNTAVSFTNPQGVTFTADVLFQVADILTAEAWIKRSTTSDGDELTFICQGANALQVSVRTDNFVYAAKRGAAYMANSTTAITDTTLWHHVVVTKNGTTLLIYIDGDECANVTDERTLVDSTTFVIGRDAAGGQGFKGAIDEVSWYGTALSAARVLAHYTAAIIDPNALNWAPVIYGRGAC